MVSSNQIKIKNKHQKNIAKAERFSRFWSLNGQIIIWLAHFAVETATWQ
jgi:hypothetical protein